MKPSALAAGVYFGRSEERRSVGSLRFARTSYAPSESLPEHAHDAAYLCLALSGTFRERAGAGRDEEVRAGAVVLHRPGEVHADRFGPRPASCLNVAFGADWAERAGGWLVHEGHAQYAEPGALAPLALRLAREFERRDEASALALEGLTLELLAFFVRDAEPLGRRAPSWLATTLEQLRLEERVSLAALARTAGVHPATLARTFRRFQGCSPGEYRRRWRLARACEALRASDLPLAEIAARAGFADQSHLTRELKAALGLAPAAFRRETHRD